MSNEQNMGPNHSIKIGSKSFENGVEFRYLEMTLRNQNCIKDETKSSLNWENACYHSV